VQAYAERENSAATAHSTVLIVDDAGARDVYPEYLDFCGFKVLSAHGPIEALDVARTHRPDVILVDLARSAAGTGWDAIRSLKALAATAAIPVVALSGLTTSGESSEVRAAGADVCLPKPCLPSQIARAIRAQLLWPRRA
jgi:two-component system cell cycle response regulator DivK